MPYLRNVLYLILVAVVSPVLLWRAWRMKKYRSGWRQKLFGRVPRRVGTQPCIWFHAVSVGEVKLLRPLVDELARRRPDWEIVISTGTPTGLEVARADFPDLAAFYAPLDFSWAVRRAMARIRPSILALVELELWPNLIAAAHHHGARVAIVNGRLSERSFGGYKKIQWALASTLRQLDLVACQTEDYASRFADLGVPADRVKVTGSIKFDGLESDRCNPRTLAMRRVLGISASDVVFVAGSTMAGEEMAAYRAFAAARVHHPRLRLIVVPRHKERFDAVASELSAAGARLERRSALGDVPATAPVVLVDTLGELSAVWGLADVAFVGGSLFPGRGGQNMLEPAAYGASVLFGSHTHNFRDAVERLLGCGGARLVKSEADLAAALLEDLDDPEAAHRRATAGQSFVLSQHGAAARTAAELERLSAPSLPLVLVGSR